MRAANTIVMISIAAILYGVDAEADEPDVDSQGRTAEQIINEARARVEAGTPPPEVQKRNNHKADDDQEPPRPITYYVGFTGTNPPSMSLRAMYDQRAAQRAAAPLQYLKPMVDERDKDNEDAMTLFAGVGLTERLEVEFVYSTFSRHEVGVTPVIDTTLTGTQVSEASQGSQYSGAEYSATLLAHWRFHQLWSVYGRIGIGHAETMLLSTLASSGRTTSEQQCVPQNDGTTKCSTIYHHVGSYRESIRDDGQGFYPIIGGGIEFVRAFRLEFTYRPFVPIANTTTDVLSDFMISIRLYNTDWLVMQ